MPIFEISTIETRHRMYRLRADSAEEAEKMIRENCAIATDDVSEGEKIEITQQVED